MFINLPIFVLLVVGHLVLLPLLGELALDGGTKDIVILDQGQLVDGKVLRQLPAIKVMIMIKVLLMIVLQEDSLKSNSE